MKVILKKEYKPVPYACPSLVPIGTLVRSSVDDDILLRICDGWVSLVNPSLTWSPDISFKIVSLPKGFQITLEQE